MGKNVPSRPFYCDSIALMMQWGVMLIARCPRCDNTKYGIDLEAIASAKGPDYCLWNRTAKCTFTEGCKGRVGFRYKYGMMDCGMRD